MPLVRTSTVVATIAVLVALLLVCDAVSVDSRVASGEPLKPDTPIERWSKGHPIPLPSGDDGRNPILDNFDEVSTKWKKVEYVELPHMEGQGPHGARKPKSHYKPKIVPEGYFRKLAQDGRGAIEAKREAKYLAQRAKKRSEICGFCTGLVNLLERLIQMENSFKNAMAPLQQGCTLLAEDFKTELPNLDCDAAAVRLTKISAANDRVDAVKGDLGCQGDDCATDLSVSFDGCKFLDIDFCVDGKALALESSKLLGSGGDAAPVIAKVPARRGGKTSRAVPIKESPQIEAEASEVAAPKETKKPEAAEEEDDKSAGAAASPPAKKDDSKVSTLEAEVAELKEQNAKILASLDTLGGAGTATVAPSGPYTTAMPATTSEAEVEEDQNEEEDGGEIESLRFRDAGVQFKQVRKKEHALKIDKKALERFRQFQRFKKFQAMERFRKQLKKYEASKNSDNKHHHHSHQH